MKIALIHYHLKTGGVTSVIRHQIKAVGQDCDVLVLTGHRPETALKVPVKTIDGLGYDVFCPHQPAAQSVAAAITDAIESHFGGSCDLVHVHNPTLAKNRQFLKILNILQSHGLKLLLQVHDFAEDGRPLVYFREDYPHDCHYAVINSRDRNLLRSAGCVPEGVHLLPNPVHPPEKKKMPGPAEPRVLYPIRAIRRKNIGESILLSLFFKPKTRLAITLPPNSPADFESYNGWKRFVSVNHLGVDFEVGMNADFSNLVHGSRFLITTSITEGFGYSFLEPWLYDKAIRGRRLPDICADFEEHGIDLQDLYTELEVPLVWIDTDAYYARWREAVIETAKMFTVAVDDHQLNAAFDRMTGDRDTIDFGLLSEPFQKSVIVRLLSEKTAFARLKEQNRLLSRLDATQMSPDRIARNHEAIAAAYHPSAYRSKLLQTYAAVARRSVRQRIDKTRLLDSFFNIEHFSLLKWGPYVE